MKDFLLVNIRDEKQLKKFQRNSALKQSVLLLLLISVFLQRITEGISLDCSMASSALSCFYGKHVTFGNLV